MKIYTAKNSKMNVKKRCRKDKTTAIKKTISFCAFIFQNRLLYSVGDLWWNEMKKDKWIYKNVFFFSFSPLFMATIFVLCFKLLNWTGCMSELKTKTAHFRAWTSVCDIKKSVVANCKLMIEAEIKTNVVVACIYCP